MHSVRITDIGPGRGQRVEIDDRELRGVTDVTITMNKDSRPVINITLLPQILRYDGKLADVLIDRGVEILSPPPPEDAG